MVSSTSAEGDVMISLSICLCLVFSFGSCQRGHRDVAQMFYSLAGNVMKPDVDEDRTAGIEIMRQVETILSGMRDFIQYCQTCGPDAFYALLPTIRFILFEGKPEFVKLQSLTDVVLMSKFVWPKEDVIRYRECIGKISDILVDIYKEFMMKEQRVSRITTPTTVKPTKGSSEESSLEVTYEDSSEDSSSEDLNYGFPFKLP